MLGVRTDPQILLKWKKQCKRPLTVYRPAHDADSARGLNRFWRPYPHCTFRGPGNVQSPQLEMYNIRPGEGGGGNGQSA